MELWGQLGRSFSLGAKDIKRSDGDLGFSFSPGGLLIGYHIGVVDFLRRYGYIQRHTHITGASSGAITALMLALETQTDKIMQSIYRVQRRCREKGAVHNLHRFLLDEIIHVQEDDTYMKVNERPGRVTTVFKSIVPWKNVFVHKYRNNKDLQDCILASCNIPFFLQESFLVKVRNFQAVDGFFCDIANYGCCNTIAKRSVSVVCYYTPINHIKKLKKNGIYQDGRNNYISPHLYTQDENDVKPADVDEYYRCIEEFPAPEMDEQFVASLDKEDTTTEVSDSPASPDYFSNFSKDMIKNVMEWIGSYPFSWEKPVKECESYVEFINQYKAKNQLPQFPFTANSTLDYALNPSNEETVRMLYELGRADAFRWIVRERKVARKLEVRSIS